MAAIYEPSGAAREYSPLAMNYITGCDHGCVYCLSPDTKILMSDGKTKPIEHLSIGDNIIGVTDGSRLKKYITTQILNKIKTKKRGYRVEFDNGIFVVCSSDHRWLSDRGWKYTRPADTGQRPYLTINNFVLSIGRLFESKKETDDYCLGYLSGMIHGDAMMAVYDYSNKYRRVGRSDVQKTDIQHHFRLALKDEDGLHRTKEYLSNFGVEVNYCTFNNGERGTLKAIRTHDKNFYHKIKELINFNNVKTSEWYRGWLSGIFDAEGSFSTVLRISNYNESINQITSEAFDIFGFDHLIEEKGVRLRGGLSEVTRFFNIIQPSISRKFAINGISVKDSAKIKSITDTGETIDMYDITTGTENFIANGLVSHNCYVPKIMKRFRSNYIHSDVYIKEESTLLKEIERSAKKHEYSERQVFLSFLTDPYSHFNNDTKLTRRVLKILLKHKIPVSILSKGGFNILQDLDIIKEFGENIQVGASLTFTNIQDSKKWEKNSSLPEERFEALKKLHQEGVRTWASMEPVIYPEQSLEIMEETKDYVDGYKVGKLNHFPNHEKKFDWNDFLRKTVEVMRKNDKLFYIKDDLYKWISDDISLHSHERDMDYMSISNKFVKEQLLF